MVNLGDASRNHLVGITRHCHRPFKHLGDEFFDETLTPLARARVAEASLLYDLIKKTSLRDQCHRCRCTASHFLRFSHWFPPSRRPRTLAYPTSRSCSLRRPRHHRACRLSAECL